MLNAVGSIGSIPRLIGFPVQTGFAVSFEFFIEFINLLLSHAIVSAKLLLNQLVNGYKDGEERVLVSKFLTNSDV